MGRIEGERGKVAERADLPAVELCSQGVAAILDQPQPVPATELGHTGGVEGDSHGVGDQHAARPRTDGRGDRLQAGNIGSEIDVDKDRHGADSGGWD